MINLGDGFVALKSPNGDFISCDINNNGKITVASGWMGAWEVFKKIELPEGAFALKAVNDKFVTLKQDKESTLSAEAETIGPNERFVFQ